MHPIGFTRWLERKIKDILEINKYETSTEFRIMLDNPMWKMSSRTEQQVIDYQHKTTQEIFKMSN